MIGVFIVLFAWASGKGVGISSGFAAGCARCFPSLSFFRKASFQESWRLLFLLGIPLGGLAGAGGVTASLGPYDLLSSGTLAAKIALLFAGGFLGGFGARWAGG